jgi:hypothetical protein
MLDMLNDKYDALSRFRDEYIQFPPFLSAFNDIQDLLQLYRTRGIAEHMLVLGESGTGKTTLCKLLLQTYPRIILLERDVIPVLFVPIPPEATIASVTENMLEILGDPAPATGTTPVKTRRAVHLARACRVELLLFDEANHIQDRGQSHTQYLVGDWIKALMDIINVPTVLLGLPRVSDLLCVNEQLRRRFLRVRKMELGQDPENTIATQCLQLFTSLAPMLPVPFSRGSMDWPELGLRLYCATDGRVAYLKTLLAGVIRAVFTNAITEITIQDLEQAFTDEIWQQGVGGLNPFNKSFDIRRLDRRAEPFERGAIHRQITRSTKKC